MSTNYAGINLFPATLPILDDGDAAEAASIAPALEVLADRTISLNTSLVALSAAAITTAGGAKAFVNPLVLSGSGTTWDNAVTFGATGSVQIDGTLNLNGSSQVLHTPLVASVNGRVIEQTVFGTDSDVVLLVGISRYYIVKAGVLSTARVATLSTTGAQLGDRIRVTNHDNTHNLSIAAPVRTQAGFATGLNLRNASGLPYSAECVYTGTEWQIESTIYAP